MSFFYWQNRSASVRVHLAGGSLSLSDQEFDSDELEIPLNLKTSRKRNASSSNVENGTAIKTTTASNDKIATN